MTEEQSRSLDGRQLAEVGHEAADVLLYLVQLADPLGIDLLATARRKIEINGAKHPVATGQEGSRRAGDT
jgi:NTP pyrophosphatase (non-canonical NTP hydrolase)